MNLNDDALQALVRLDDNPDFRVLIASLRNELTDAGKGLQVATELLQIGRYQGQVALLEELIGLTGEARDILHKRGRR